LVEGHGQSYRSAQQPSAKAEADDAAGATDDCNRQQHKQRLRIWRRGATEEDCSDASTSAEDNEKASNEAAKR